MTMMLDVVAAGLATVLLGFTTVALVLGLEGGFTGERFERCPRCHRYGMTFDGRRHPLGCPPALRRRLAPGHVLQAPRPEWPTGVHRALRHH